MNLNEECLISACVHCEAFEQSRMKIIRGVDIFHLILSSLKTSRLHAGFKSCVRVSEFSVDLENSDSVAADECEWTRSRRSDRLSPRSRTQHKSNVSVRVHVSHECTVSAFVHFPLKTLISYLTSDVKHSLRLTNPPIDRVTEDFIICVTKIFSFFSVEYQRERDSSLTRRKINDLSLDSDSMDSDLTRLKKRWRELTCLFGVFSFQ